MRPSKLFEEFLGQRPEKDFSPFSHVFARPGTFLFYPNASLNFFKRSFYSIASSYTFFTHSCCKTAFSSIHERFDLSHLHLTWNAPADIFSVCKNLFSRVIKMYENKSCRNRDKEFRCKQNNILQFSINLKYWNVTFSISGNRKINWLKIANRNSFH